MAYHYNHILEKYKKNLPEIEFGISEFLSAFIPANSACLITCQNALDHSSTPVKGIVEALSVLSLGGILYLNHHPNEAELERYKGFHQYNISEKEGDFVLWNKTEHINITNLLKGYAHVSTVRMDNGHIVSIITKTSENPPCAT